MHDASVVRHRLVRLTSLACAALVLALCATATLAAPSLDLIGRYDSGLGEGATEIAAYDAASARLYVVNAASASFDIIDLSNPAMPALIQQVDVTTWGAEANSVAVCGDLVAVAVEADDTQANGVIVFFRLDGTFLSTAEVGALPDMVTCTSDAQTALVANEGEPNDEYTVDPEGSVSILDLSAVAAGGAAVVTNVGFADFDIGGPRHDELPGGVRVFGPGASVAQDLEPEYITISPDDSTAFVALQEANALAVVDIESATIVSILALGTKDHSVAGAELDPSNRDDGIEIANWPVLGLYMPDGIDSYEVAGQVYVVTANEGDSRDYDGYSEEERMGDLDLDPTAFPNAATLQEDENLGRLKTTITEGDTDGDGDYDALYSYGARSFSIWAADGTLVYDSGSDFETIIAAQAPDIFNADGSDPDEFDDRSDDKGPEPESVVLGRIGARVFAFVGLERVGGIMVYDVTDPGAPEFVLYRRPVEGDQAPEGIVFVPAGDSPTLRPLVIAAHEDSGTVTVFEVNDFVGTGACADDAETLCLRQGRFAVTAAWETVNDAGPGRSVELTDDTGSFWFFGADNLEILVKVLDGCPINEQFWVYSGGTTDVGVTLEVTDTVTGTSKTYATEVGQPITAIRDVAFGSCD